MAKRFKYIDDHAFIDTANKAEIVIRGLRYAVLYQDIENFGMYFQNSLADLYRAIINLK